MMRADLAVAAATTARGQARLTPALRIGLLCHHGMGGSAKIAVELAGALAARGCEAHIFARAAPLGAPPPPGVVVHTLGPGPARAAVTARLDAHWSVQDQDALADLVATVTRDRQLDVLHFHYAIPFAAIVDRVRDRVGPPRPALIGTLHGTDVSEFGGCPQTAGTLAALLGRLDAVTTVSRSHAALAESIFGMRPRLIPNFVDPARYYL